MGKVRAFLIIVVGVFLGGAIPVFLTNLASEEVGWNIWKVPLSTWQIIVTMGIAGIGIAWLVGQCGISLAIVAGLWKGNQRG